jgi:hypothetical protein
MGEFFPYNKAVTEMENILKSFQLKLNLWRAKYTAQWWSPC